MLKSYASYKDDGLQRGRLSMETVSTTALTNALNLDLLQRGRLSMETVSAPAALSELTNIELQRGRLSMETVSDDDDPRLGEQLEASTRPTLDGDGELACRRDIHPCGT